MNTNDPVYRMGCMKDKKEGLFTQSIKGLEIQLKTLFYGSGNEHSLAFLDAVSELGLLEQEILLKYFTEVTLRVASGDRRYFTADDAARKSFEDQLYNEIVTAMDDAAQVDNLTGKRLEVLEGGRKERRRSALVDLASRRKALKSVPKPILN